MKKLHISVPVNPIGSIESHLIEWIFSPELDQMANARGWEIRRAICRDRPVVSTRNRLVKQFLDGTDHDVLLSIDSDQVPQYGSSDMVAGLDRMLDAIERPDVDVVNALTLRGTAKGPLPVLSKIVSPLKGELFSELLDRERGLHELKTVEMKDGVPTEFYGAMGGAALMVTREVLEKFRKENVLWFWDVFCEKQGVHVDEFSGKDVWGERLIGHDYWFFCKCHELGFRCWVDTKVFWGHVKPCDMRLDFRREMGLLEEVKNAECERDRFKAEVAMLRKQLSEVPV